MQLELCYFNGASAENTEKPHKSTGQLKDTKRLKTVWLGLVTTLHLYTATRGIAAVLAKSLSQKVALEKSQQQTNEKN